jgi:hypothetical protein
MNRHTIVALFHEYGAAHRALCELEQSGIPSNDISIIAGDRSDRRDADRDFGVLADDAETYIAAVRHGTTLLAVRVDDVEQARVADIIEQHTPIKITHRDSDPVSNVGADKLSGRPRRDEES